MKKLFFLMLFFTLLHAKESIIIVPGTWSAKATWHQPGGEFFQELQHTAGHDTLVTTFTWSGKNKHGERLHAAEQLAELIKHHKNVILVTHSHGGNIAILASKILGSLGYRAKIKAVYALATPIAADDYLPDMNVITHFYQFFSYADTIQPVFGIFERILPAHECITNINITINGHEPDHEALHHPALARWFMTMHKELQPTPDPLTIHFFDNKPPIYALDYDRHDLLVQDAWFEQQLGIAYERGIPLKN